MRKTNKKLVILRACTVGDLRIEKELLDEAKNFYASKGYAISIKNSKKDEYVTIGCDLGGVYRDRRKTPVESRTKETSTRLINCPFKIQGKKKSDEFWIIEVKNSSLNHDPSLDMSGHPSCRRFTQDEKLDVEKMSNAGIQPRHILSSLRQKNPKIQAVSRTVYNVKTKIRKDKLDGRSMIQALFDELGQAGFVYNYKQDDEGRLTHVFFAHPKSMILSKLYWAVFVMDCTYKTNKYKMPLLDIIGVSSSNKSFYSCFVFLRKESVEDYIWALEMFKEMMGPTFQPLVIVSDREKALMNAIQIVFPDSAHLWCVWHIQKILAVNCKAHFKQNEWDTFLSTWNSVMYAETEQAFEDAWLELVLTYEDKKCVIAYLEENLLPHKQRFVTAWTDKKPHFGNRASSQAEGAHSKLKGYLQVSTGDFSEVRTKICLAIDNEFQEIKTQQESERLRVPHRLRIPYFKLLVNCVSTFALNLLYEQYEMTKYKNAKSVCTGNFTATMGLPCAHMMINCKEVSLSLEYVNSQWRIGTACLATSSAGMVAEENEIDGLVNELQERYKQMPIIQQKEVKEKLALMLHSRNALLLEPNVESHKGRPLLGSKRKEPMRSTRRDPSKFEIVEASLNNKSKKQRVTDDVEHEPWSFSMSGSRLSHIDLNAPLSLDSSNYHS